MSDATSQDGTMLATLCRFGMDVVDAGLLASSCGNVSVRTGEHLLISASGAQLGKLAEADVAAVDLASGRHLTGPRPSMETGIHRRIYEARPGVGAVLHCQSRAATLLACCADPPRNLDFIPEVPAYVRAHAYVAYHAPGSGGLAEDVREAFTDPEVTVVQMRNHGQVIIGADPAAVVRRATFFELACWMAVQGLEGLKLNAIPAEDAAVLRGYARDV